MGKKSLRKVDSPSQRRKPQPRGRALEEPTRPRLGAKAAFIVLITLIVYIPAIEGGFIWDDDKYVTANPTLRSVDGLADIWLSPRSSPQYYPLVFTSFWLEYRLWGASATGYHLVNVLLHALSAVLLWLLLRDLEVPGAWFAAVVFALHPVHVESVAWITERKNVLSGVFYFSSALCLFRYLGLSGKAGEGPRNRLWYGFGLLLYMCALLSKTVASTLPAAMLLILWWKRGRLSWKEVATFLPFFGVGLALGLSTVWLELYHVGAQGEEYELAFLERVLVAGRAWWFYVGKLVWPAELIFTYPRWQIESRVWWQYAYPLGVLLAVSALWVLRGRLGRGPLVGVLYFSVTLLPALGFFDVYPFRFSFVADHFQYVASVGIIALAVAAVTRVASGLSLWPRRTLAASALLALSLLAGKAWSQGYIYKDPETLWRDTVKRNPSSWHRHYDLATILARQGKFEEAVVHFSETLKLKSDSADAYNNLGNVLAAQGKTQEAISHYTEALRIDPDHREAHYNLAVALVGNGRVEDAITHLSEHLRISPDHGEAHYNLGVILAERGKLQEALSQFSDAVRLNPRDVAARRNLELCRRLMGKSPATSKAK